MGKSDLSLAVGGHLSETLASTPELWSVRKRLLYLSSTGVDLAAEVLLVSALPSPTS